MYILIAVLLLVIAIFGVASITDSYATAKQAQATIEVAQVAQVNAWGNLIVIMLLALVILCVVGVIVWMSVSRGQRENNDQRTAATRQQMIQRALQSPPPPAPPPTLETLVQLKTLELLDRMSRPASSQNERGQLLDAQDGVDDLSWLRRG